MMKLEFEEEFYERLREIVRQEVQAAVREHVKINEDDQVLMNREEVKEF